MSLVKHSERTVRKPCRTCGGSDLYWSHDTDRPYGKDCDKCHVNGRFVLMERDGSRHSCGDTGQAPEASETAPEPSPEPNPAPVLVATGTADPAMQAFQAFMAAVAPKVDAGQVHQIVDERLRGLVLPMRVEVVRDGIARPVDGLAHRVLPTVIEILSDGDHVLMVGPAGTGKSHIAHQAADALGFEFYSISLTAATPPSMITGYMDANGQYVRTAFREAFENGGVFLFDEVDNGNANALGVVNSALANGSMAFPDGMVKRHPDFLCVASANTYGRGADRQFVGRQALDAAFMDRFEVIPVDYDESLEEALCMATGLDSIRVKQVLGYVRCLRATAIRQRMPLSFGPRRSRALCKRLNRGMATDQAIMISVRRGISDSDWAKVSDGVPSI